MTMTESIPSKLYCVIIGFANSDCKWANSKELPCCTRRKNLTHLLQSKHSPSKSKSKLDVGAGIFSGLVLLERTRADHHLTLSDFILDFKVGTTSLSAILANCI